MRSIALVPVAATLSAVAALSIAWAQSPGEQPARADELSVECRVPPSELFVPAALPRVAATVAARDPLTVLAIGGAQRQSAMQGQAVAPYPDRLEKGLQSALHVEVSVTARRLREITARAGDTVMSAVGEVSPELVVWQVGTNDALAHADLPSFSEALDDLLKWLRSHEIDVILVEPPYTSALAGDQHFADLVQAIDDSSKRNGVALVRRSNAMRYLERRVKEGEHDRFEMQNRAYHCTPEHVSELVKLSLTAEPPKQ
jgi:lysophospholipase L1-like esterase